MKLEDSGAKPKSTAGRRAIPLDKEFTKALADAFSKNPFVEADGETRPRMLGPDTEFKTKGKATSQARRYQAELEKSDIKVRVTALELHDEKNNVTGYKWRLYMPLSEQETETAEAA